MTTPTRCSRTATNRPPRSSLPVVQRPSDKSKLKRTWEIGLLTACLLAALATWSVGAFLVVAGDASPAGPSCDWEFDEGSGPAGSGGRETVRWGYFPSRECVVVTSDGRVHRDYLGGAVLTPLSLRRSSSLGLG